MPVVYLRRIADLETFVSEQDLQIVLYVNQNAKNFQMFRYGRMWHVFINHGESDKMYMTTNQFKAYDYSPGRRGRRDRPTVAPALELRPRDAGDPDRTPSGRPLRRPLALHAR